MKKTKTSLSQLGAIYALLSKHHLSDDKANIILNFTATRTDSVREMYFDEAGALIAHLKSLDPSDKSADKMRNKIISMAHEMGWRVSGTDNIDMKHVNQWCITYGYLKKKLDDHTYNELPKLVSQFEEVYKSFINKV